MNINSGARFWREVFLAILKREKHAHIVNLSSVFGIIAPANMCLLGEQICGARIHEALRHELAGGNMGVSCLHPGGIQTPIARRSRIGAGTSESSAKKY